MTFIEYFQQILRSYFTPYKHCDFTGTVLWYYHRPWVTCALECHKNNLHNLFLFGNFNLQDLLQLSNHNIQISP